MASEENTLRTPIVEMRGITKHFPGVLANDHIDLRLYPGEVLALLGENGAGKSTLMNVLVGLYRQDRGEISVENKRVEIYSPRDASSLGIGMVHQNFMLVNTMTVAENIILGMLGLSIIPDMNTVARRIGELSNRYSLRVDPKSFIWQLSVGEQQRVEILKLIYRGAQILILEKRLCHFLTVYRFSGRENWLPIKRPGKQTHRSWPDSWWDVMCSSDSTASPVSRGTLYWSSMMCMLLMTRATRHYAV
jgi:ABC-type sugar transport system ATPase subunit